MPDGVFGVWVMALAAAVMSWGCIAALRRYAITHAVLDHPTERSSHTVPTPRGGGAGVLLATLAAYLLFVPSGSLDWRASAALSAVIPTAIAGWVDDHGPLPVLPRVAAHLSSGLLLLPLALGPEGFTPVSFFIGAGWLAATVSAINVVNFLDGIDGLIATQAVVFGIHLAVLGGVDSRGGMLALALAAAFAAFLFWNWPPARIFLGDVGSGALAVLGLVAGILVWLDGPSPFLALYLPLFLIFLDASVTIIRRVRRGERLSAAHRTHLYQRLANEGPEGGAWGHAKVSMMYGALAALGMATATVSPEGGLLSLCAAYMVVVSVAYWMLDRSVAR